jgi:hypothetical protein
LTNNDAAVKQIEQLIQQLMYFSEPTEIGGGTDLHWAMRRGNI